MQEKLTLLNKYLKSTSVEDFDTIPNSVVFWVDWREEDDAVVAYCEKRLQTGQLSATMEDKPDGLELQITFQGTTHRDIVVDRDRTIIFLNSIIQPNYEIRFCKASEGSDTLAFLPLTATEWQQLEAQYGADVINSCFESINTASEMFNKSYDFEMEDDQDID
ncbi:MAG: hypothetical protein JO154_02140 [Chitinophaga sp.]|uniref:hypothetical protein n=1 Tax=Chitinophaga sp. TaxID=1869181 RepID=UPI0025C2E4F0|nr:hypothetical protein [Chitinophaga sp.]MBV8251381.1 hypothetical protein [Chitinophaga sp.]